MTLAVFFFENRDAIFSYHEDFIKSYAPENIDNTIQIQCEVRKASEIFWQNNTVGNLIIKCDFESAEYDIFWGLAQNYPEIFDKTVKMIGETHLGFD